ARPGRRLGRCSERRSARPGRRLGRRSGRRSGRSMGRRSGRRLGGRSECRSARRSGRRLGGRLCRRPGRRLGTAGPRQPRHGPLPGTYRPLGSGDREGAPGRPARSADHDHEGVVNDHHQRAYARLALPGVRLARLRPRQPDRGPSMNATTYRWLIASHVEQVKAYLQRLETELEKIDSAEADDGSKHPTDTQATIAALRAEGFVEADTVERLRNSKEKDQEPQQEREAHRQRFNVDADRLEITDEEGDCLRVDVYAPTHIIRAVIRSSGGVEVHLEAEDVRALIATLVQSVAEPATG